MIEMILVAAAPSIALLIFIYQKDRYDREPAGLLFALFFLGILSTIPVYFIEKFLVTLNPYSILFRAFIVAGLTEETSKLFIVNKIAYNNRNYNEKLDGIIYSVFVSLGFATAENFLYVFTKQINYIYTGVSRALFAVPAHMLFAITMGYYLSLAKFSPNYGLRKIYILESLLIPVLLHGAYDFILFSQLYKILPLFIIFIIYLWKVNLSRLNRYVEDSRNRR